MTLPQVFIDVGFTSTATTGVFTVGHPTLGQVGVVPIGASDIWTDVTPYVRSWSVKRGASDGDSPTLRYNPGTASIEFNDGFRMFDPENLAGPFVSAGVTQVEAMRRVRIRAVYGGITYAIFYGYADDWVPSYQGNSWTYTTLPATDGSVLLSGVDRAALASPVGASEYSGDRVTRILNAAGWPATDRVIDGGDTTLQATTMAGTPLAELQLVQDTEQGEFYIDAQGRAVFRERRATLSNDRSTDVQARFGDAGWFQPLSYDFESGIDGWGPGFGGTVAATATAFTGAGALELTVSGSPAQSYVRPTVDIPVAAGQRYQVTMWVRRSAGTSMVAAIDWKDASRAYLSGAYTPYTVTAGVWTQIQVVGTAPTGAAYMAFGPTADSSPANGTTMQLDSVSVVSLDNEIPYADAKMSTPGDTVVNTVYASIAGGTEQSAIDPVSVGRYQTKSHTRDDLIGETDSMAFQWANWLKYQFSAPRRRFARLEFNTPAPQVESAFWPALLGRDFGDRITVVRRPAGGGAPITRDCFVRGVEHSSNGVEWTSAFVLQGADRYAFLTIGDPILGRVGMNAVAY